MKAWLLQSFDGLSALRLTDSVDRPKPGTDEVLIRIRYAALNPADRYLAEKLYPARPKLPHILGRDGCGTLEEIGQNVSTLKIGDRVAILRSEAGVEKPGTFAEFAAVPEQVVVRTPEDWEPTQAAAAPLVYLTALQALNQWGSLAPTTVLITGVSGGVGIASLHLAKAYGHLVIGLSRGSSKVDKLTNLGCDHVLDPGDTQLKQRIRNLAGPSGVGLIIDNVAGELLSLLIDTLGYQGKVSLVGMLAGPVPQFNTAKLFFKRLRLGGVAVYDYSPEQAQAAWREIVALLNKINARPVIDSVYPMNQLHDAFDRLAEGPIGKVLLELVPRHPSIEG